MPALARKAAWEPRAYHCSTSFPRILENNPQAGISRPAMAAMAAFGGLRLSEEEMDRCELGCVAVLVTCNPATGHTAAARPGGLSHALRLQWRADAFLPFSRPAHA